MNHFIAIFYLFSILLLTSVSFGSCKPRIIESGSLKSESSADSDFLKCKSNIRGFALVVTGYAMSDVAHDFSLHTAMLSKGMAARGYCVVTLFSEQIHALADPKNGQVSMPTEEEARQFGVPEKEIPEWVAVGKTRVEAMYYRDDVNYFQKQGLLTPDRKATKENIDRFFSAVLNAKVPKSSKRIFMSLGAHGHAKYTDKNLQKSINGVSVYDPNLLEAMNKPEMSSDFCRGATHECTLNSCQGLQELYDTNELQKHFYNASVAGYQSWLAMRSCHSGGLRKALTKVPNLCFQASTIGFSPSHGCGEVDPLDNPDYSSTSDGVVQLLSQPAMAEMSNDAYFKGKKCFAKYLKHARNAGFQNKKNSLSEMFWTARKYDRTWDHATISSLDDFKYFQGNEYSVNLRFYLPLDLERLEENLTQLSADSGLMRLRSQVMNSARSYQPTALKITKIQSKLDNLYKLKKYDSPEIKNLRGEVEQLNDLARKSSENFLKMERQYIDAVRQRLPVIPNDPCRAEL